LKSSKLVVVMMRREAFFHRAFSSRSSGQELQRKLNLELEELKKLEQQMSLLSQSTCP
jgi:hypothetical protein